MTSDPVRTSRTATGGRVRPVEVRSAGFPQGACILLASMLPAMGVTLLSPNIPAITAAVGDQPGGAYLISIALTIPALVIAIVSGFAGIVVDRFGRRVCLLGALGLYAVFGVFPAFSTSLVVFIIMRGLLGVVEAVIMTSTLALIADYFHGAERSRWLAYSTGFTAVMSIVVYVVAGALGEIGWRFPFYFYGTAALILALAVKVIWEPSRAQLIEEDASLVAQTPNIVMSRLFATPFVTALVLSAVGGALFFVIPLQIAEYYGQHGLTSPALIGALIAVATVGNAIGALGFRFVAHFPRPYLIAGAMGVSATGLLLLPFCATVTTVTVAAFINQLGAGMLPPLLMSITMSVATAFHRGRAGGLFWSAFSIGNFLSPIIMVSVISALGSLAHAFVAVAVLCVVIAGLSVGTGSRLFPEPKL